MLSGTMDLTIIVLLIVVVAFAAALYYLYIHKGWYDWGYRARASIIVLVGVLVPVLVMALWQQHHARDALAAHGVSIHPALGSSVGIATGSVASGEHWVFEFDGKRSELLGYYREASHRPGWDITEDNGVFLILSRGDQRLMIAGGDATAVFQLSRVLPQMPGD